MKLMQLPDTIILEILKNFENVEILPLRQLSKEIQKLVNSTLTFRLSTYLKGGTGKEHSLLKRVGPVYTTLDLYQTEDTTMWETFAKLCPRIETVSVEFGYDFEGLKKTLKKLNNILLLNSSVTNLYFNISRQSKIDLNFKNLSRIRSLTLFINTEDSENDTKMLECIELEGLTKLCLSVDLKSTFLSEISTRFPNLQSLKLKNLGGEQSSQDLVNSVHGVNLKYFIPKLTYLRCVDINCQKSIPWTMPFNKDIPNLCTIILDINKFIASSSRWLSVQQLHLKVGSFKWQGLSYHFPNIKRLYISSFPSGIFTDSITELANLNSLSHLKLSIQLSRHLLDLKPLLQKLVFLKVEIDVDSLKSLIEYCSSKLLSLRELDVKAENTNGRILTTLGQLKSPLPSLKRLKINLHRNDLINLLIFVSHCAPHIYSLDLKIHGGNSQAPTRFTRSQFSLPHLMIFTCSLRLKYLDYVHLLKLAPNLTEINTLSDLMLSMLREEFKDEVLGGRVLTSKFYRFYDSWQ